MKKIEKEDSYSHIFKYTGIFGGVQGLNILIGVVRNKLVAMILGPEGMGLISLFNSTIKLISDSSNLGIGMSAVREMSQAYVDGDDETLKRTAKMIRTWSLLAAILGGLLCIVLSPLLSSCTFSWGNHVLHFMLLSLVVALTAITGGELAILKGMRQLKRLAMISVYGLLGSLLTSIPLYLIWKEAAIVPSLIIMALLQMLFTITYSYRLLPLDLNMVNRRLLGEGKGMIRLGSAFVLAGMFGSGAEFLIRSYLNHVGGLEVVGLYNAAYVMTLTYAGIVFQAMETDYFPRLSSVCHDIGKLNMVVNRQIEVSLLLVSPLLAFFIVGAPVLLPLLYSGKFMAMIGMLKITVFAMYIRAVVLPIEYISLSRGDSWNYLMVELFYDLIIVLYVVVGFRWGGLNGTGVSLLLAGACNLLFVLIFMRIKYGYRISASVVLYACLQIPWGILAYVETFCLEGIAYWVVGGCLCLVSFLISLGILYRKAPAVLDKLVLKIKSRFTHG